MPQHVPVMHGDGCFQLSTRGNILVTHSLYPPVFIDSCLTGPHPDRHLYRDH